jgi:16S rRNA (guanine527-N7)-methyltransferase
MLTWDELPGCFPELPRADRWLPLLQEHARILEAHRGEVRTTSVAGPDMVFRHYAECLELLRIVSPHLGSGPVIDVGPGGGFPGLVFAAILPALPITLVEPSHKRAALLEAAVEAMALPRVTVVAARAEEAGRGALRETATLVTARAVAPLVELLEYCAPLARPDGRVALPKGSGAAGEIERAAVALRELACVVAAVEPMRPQVSASPFVVMVEKTGRVPERYPRRPGMPRKRPLGEKTA